ncbi:hypothetical protein [Devosia ginsengisoli]|uniref:hypothetical protein n=1 Tax=Devosia ginsengisoli TaxID=400770 RepID=UPI0034E9364D
MTFPRACTMQLEAYFTFKPEATQLQLSTALCARGAWCSISRTTSTACCRRCATSTRSTASCRTNGSTRSAASTSRMSASRPSPSTTMARRTGRTSRAVSS